MITLATLPQATDIEVFLQGKNHLLKQNQQSIGEEDICKYRAGHLRCAAGCFIGDREYKPTMEFKSWQVLNTAGMVPSKHKDLIIALQDIHDNYKVADWGNRLDALGEGVKKGEFSV